MTLFRIALLILLSAQPAIAQPQLAWEHLGGAGGQLVLGTPGGDDMILRLECSRNGQLVITIPTSRDHSSGFIYFFNRDVAPEPFVLDVEFFPEDKEFDLPPHFVGNIAHPHTFLSFLAKGKALQLRGAVTMSVPLAGASDALMKLLGEKPC